MMTRCFLDTNIFLYASGKDHPEKQPCTRLLEMAASREIQAVTSSEVLQEVLHVRMRRGTRQQAAIAVREMATYMEEILPVTCADILDACTLLLDHPALSSRDAVHAAVAKKNSIPVIVSADSDFDMIPGLRRLTAKQAAV